MSNEEEFSSFVAWRPFFFAYILPISHKTQIYSLQSILGQSPFRKWDLFLSQIIIIEICGQINLLLLLFANVRRQIALPYHFASRPNVTPTWRDTCRSRWWEACWATGNNFHLKQPPGQDTWRDANPTTHSSPRVAAELAERGRCLIRPPQPENVGVKRPLILRAVNRMSIVITLSVWWSGWSLFLDFIVELHINGRHYLLYEILV